MESVIDVTTLARSLAADPSAVLLDVRWWPGRPAALYVGSWSSWVTGPAQPVATGPEPG